MARIIGFALLDPKSGLQLLRVWRLLHSKLVLLERLPVVKP
jgi:hypothetical protein